MALVTLPAWVAAELPARAADRAQTALEGGVGPQEALRAAHRAFVGGDFAAAAKGYQGLIEAGGDSGWLFYNLGNSHLRQGQLGQAVAALLEAQARLPRASEVRANLAWARSQTTDALVPPAPLALWQVLAFWHFALNLREVAWGAAAAQLACCLLVAWAQLAPASGGRRAAIYLCLALTTALGGSLAWRLTAPRTVAVVTSAESQVHSAPHAEAVVRFRLHDGAEAQLGREEGDWAQITLSDGKRGWVPTAEISRLRLR